MVLLALHDTLLAIQKTISLVGILIILTGVIISLTQYLQYLFMGKIAEKGVMVNLIRLNLGRILLLGLECIVAADLIGTTTAPDYYSVGIVACIVVIRTILSFTINKEITSLSKDQLPQQI